ncbi:bifunctional proline dehydrogenase/L-glutamate gamma-semialdehyde dehydrogenase PutA [Flaviflagellibacter deserti]|uniref:Bifunctional protein PutA n=1 Tax=Flaviflagellibacter deserti TaxID=2267266 RepID=A0ABV9YVS5_9HYPH
MSDKSIAWDDLDRGKYRDEAEAVRSLLNEISLSTEQRDKAMTEAAWLVRTARAAGHQGLVESFMQEFSLGTREGLVLMCLAEALLRTPDDDTRDRLIAEKIASADWASHRGQSDSLFVNASTWGLMLTGRLIDVGDAKKDIGGFMRRMVGRLGEPVIRTAIGRAIAMMSEQFVLGRDIAAALRRADRENLLCSFDMLGEGARTEADADRYEKAYAHAIGEVGKAAGKTGPETEHGVSVKLSALSPRYEAVQEARVWETLYPRMKRLALEAKRYDINLTIDAEEADRLALSLKLLERLVREGGLGAWKGLGLAVQSYQKRAPEVIERVGELARQTGRRLMVRLVKGAYWDTEVKRAQIAGRLDYPVFTTKAATDLSYLVCAQRMIDAAPHIFPQFATHNAHTLATVREMAERAGVACEFQRLHGMGQSLYAAAKKRNKKVSVRTYAPVGSHEELLPYLVRRLLENGANTSFVHAFLDEEVPVDAIISDPVPTVREQPDRHPKIPPPPPGLYGSARKNSAGIDLTVRSERDDLALAIGKLDRNPLHAKPLGGTDAKKRNQKEVRSPADHSRVVGRTSDATPKDIDAAVARSRKAQRAWDAAGGAARAKVLRAMADALEADRGRLIAILSREGGKTLADGISEVREAADFCRYYAHLAEKQFSGPEVLTGPAGERNLLSLHGRGVFACISPWNFPLAIFTGQIAAALAAGNAVLAKPAEQTPLIAHAAVLLFHRAGLDPDLLSLIPGDGATVGSTLVNHPEIDGVAFTGGTETAWAINRSLAARNGPIVPFIAETGGLNGMFVDTTALREQVIDDVVLSAFGSAGQRCSALRLLFLPNDTADMLITGIKGAMDALVIGDPANPSTDIGPVIDTEARDALERHAERLENEATILHRLEAPEDGTFFGPILAEIPAPDFLQREVFGPILHVVRYEPEKLEEVASALASLRYGLTLGVHSRIDGFADEVARLVPAGNVYVNRSIIGAVVGVQPFGGEGLSGTGPKAGGPNALLRYAVERVTSINIAAQGGDPALMNL